MLCEFLPRGDGSWTCRPLRALGDSTVSLSEAAELLGCNAKTVKRLIDHGLIATERPSPHVLRPVLKAVLAHKTASRDPEFWCRRPWLTKSERKLRAAKIRSHAHSLIA